MKQIFNIYQKVVVTVFTTYLILILIFGGSMKAEVNWNSWNKLIEHFNKNHERPNSKEQVPIVAAQTQA